MALYIYFLFKINLSRFFDLDFSFSFLKDFSPPLRFFLFFFFKLFSSIIFVKVIKSQVEGRFDLCLIYLGEIELLRLNLDDLTPLKKYF
jgi:hypothetical protein